MQLEQKKKRIGAYEYRVTVLDALAGRSLFVRLARIAAAAFDGFDPKDLDTSSTRMFAKVAGSLSEDDMDTFCDVLAASTEVAGGEYEKRSPQLKDVFALHFAGKYADMVQWLIFALEVNFGSFFARASASGAADPVAPAA